VPVSPLLGMKKGTKKNEKELITLEQCKKLWELEHKIKAAKQFGKSDERKIFLKNLKKRKRPVVLPRTEYEHLIETKRKKEESGLESYRGLILRTALPFSLGLGAIFSFVFLPYDDLNDRTCSWC